MATKNSRRITELVEASLSEAIRQYPADRVHQLRFLGSTSKFQSCRQLNSGFAALAEFDQDVAEASRR